MLISQALKDTLPTPNTENAAFQRAFAETADLLLNHAVLHIADKPYRLAEIEFYWTGPNHEDPFTHCDPMQREFAHWYFHKVGNSYKGGTYKGLDIAIGGPDYYAGVLVRAIEPIHDPDSLCDGSCSCVDRMLEVTGHASIASLADTFDVRIDAPGSGQSSPLYFEHIGDNSQKRPVYTSPRVGLSLKKGATEARCSYLARPYRFLTEPARIKKGRPNLVIGLHVAGHGASDIAGITEISASNVRKYIDSFEKGKGKDPAKHNKELSTDALCELFGSLLSL